MRVSLGCGLSDHMTERVATIASLCSLLAEGETDRARDLLNQEYPFAPEAPVVRKYGPTEATRVFVRDGFIDRYTGGRVVFPPVLRVISSVLPSEFPFHPNWKASATHSAYWEVGATVDHIVPVSRGGADSETNWVTTSMIRNFAKMNWSLEDLGWVLHPPGSMTDWDGLLGWFLRITDRQPRLVAKGSMRQWRLAAERALGRSLTSA